MAEEGGVVTGKWLKTIHLYICSHCGKQEEWGPTWSAYYEVPKSKHKKYLDPEVKYVACSDRCQLALKQHTGEDGETKP